MADPIFSKRERKGSVTAKVIVSVELEINVGGAWSPDTTLAQVDTQALDSAVSQMREIETSLRKLHTGVRLVNRPRVVRMFFEANGEEKEPKLW